MSLRDWLRSSNSSESADASLSASCRAPTTFASNRPKTKRKSADANDLGVDDPKQVRLRAYCFKHVWGQEKIL